MNKLHDPEMTARWQGKGDGWMDELGHPWTGEGTSFNLTHEATVLQRDQSHNGIKAMAHSGQDTHTSRVRGVPDGVSRAPKKNGHKWYRLDGTVETRPTGKESGLPGFILSRATDWTPCS